MSHSQSQSLTNEITIFTLHPTHILKKVRITFQCDSQLPNLRGFLVSSGEQCAAPQDVLRMKSPVLRAFPWYTGVVSKLPNFFGKLEDDNEMKVDR